MPQQRESAGRDAAHGDAKVDQFAFSCYRDHKPKAEPKTRPNILKSTSPPIAEAHLSAEF